jgi:hypothetical protein
VPVCAGCGHENEPNADFCVNRSCQRYLGWSRNAFSATDQAPGPDANAGWPDSNLLRGPAVQPTIPILNAPVPMLFEPPAYSAQVERQRLAAIPVMPSPGRVGPGPSAGQISADGNQGLMFAIDLHRINLVPGGAVVVTAHLRNRGTVVDAMNVDVIGLPTEWVTITPPTVNLFVGADGVVQIRISPPIHYTTRRGLISAEVAAWSATNPNVRCVQRLDVSVAGFNDIDARVDPAICVGRFEGKYAMTLANGGNSKLEATVRGSHDEGAVAVMCRPSTVTVAPGGQAAVTIVAKPPFLFTGSPVVYNLVMSVETADGSRSFPVKLKQPPLLTKWLARILLATLVILVAVVAVLFLHGHKAKLPSKPGAMTHSIRAGNRLVVSAPVPRNRINNER